MIDKDELNKTLDSVEEEKNAPDSEHMNEKSIAKEILTFARDLILLLIFFAIVTTFVADRTSVIGDSMEPNIHNGDSFILNKLSYHFSDPERFDIVVFPYNNSQSNYIKRIIGLPGEEIYIDFSEDLIYIDGEVLEENYGIEPIRVKGNQTYPLVIPEGEYFVMGDNRNDSSDSRYQDVGTISKEDILGKIWIRIWPLNSFGKVK